MGKLMLKFGDRVLKEVAIGTKPVVIGRSLDSDIQIDNLAVSHHHARIYADQGHLMVEDLDSANGVFLNSVRITKECLHSGDNIAVGKHVIVVDEQRDVAIFDRTPKIVTPRLQEAGGVGVKRDGDTGRGEASAESPASTRTRVPSLVVLRGKTNQKEYLLSAKLVVIGKSPMASVRMRGWFAPQLAAQVNKRPDGYYLTATTKRLPKVNGEPIQHRTRLNDGDKIELRGLVLEFVDRD
jgi:pSer/pThr/pTyr-binding forkhead associated (FHA) protein